MYILSGDFQEVYRCRFELARYFQSSGDKWLADHFFNTCLQTSSVVSNDGGKMQAEGYCNVALAQEENGKTALTLYVLMDPSFWFDTINMRWSIVYIEGLPVIVSK